MQRRTLAFVLLYRFTPGPARATTKAPPSSWPRVLGPALRRHFRVVNSFTPQRELHLALELHPRQQHQHHCVLVATGRREPTSHFGHTSPERPS